MVNLPLVVNESTKSRPNLMALLDGIRLVLLPNDMLRSMGLTMRRLLPMLLVLPLFVVFLLLLQFNSGLSFRWM